MVVSGKESFTLAPSVKINKIFATSLPYSSLVSSQTVLVSALHSAFTAPIIVIVSYFHSRFLHSNLTTVTLSSIIVTLVVQSYWPF